MEPPMHADGRRWELLQEKERITRTRWNTIADRMMNLVEFRISVDRRASAVSLLFSD
jgi:hypothetical protein